MRIEEFTQDEQKALRECVVALKNLPIYSSPEFELIFGNSTNEVEEVYNSFPNWDLYDEEAEGYDPSGDVLRNALIWLISEKDEANNSLHSKLSFPVSQLSELYRKLLK